MTFIFAKSAIRDAVTDRTIPTWRERPAPVGGFILSLLTLAGSLALWSLLILAVWLVLK